MKTHELKTDTQVFWLSWIGEKQFEIRFDDRNFGALDNLILRETVYSGEAMKGEKPLEYTGREIECKISCVIDKYGVKPGWCILGCVNMRNVIRG